MNISFKTYLFWLFIFVTVLCLTRCGDPESDSLLMSDCENRNSPCGAAFNVEQVVIARIPSDNVDGYNVSQTEDPDVYLVRYTGDTIHYEDEEVFNGQETMCYCPTGPAVIQGEPL